MDQMIRLIAANTGLSREDAYRFHLEMWIYVHGIATMVATSFLEWDQEMASAMLTDVYHGLLALYRKTKPAVEEPT